MCVTYISCKWLLLRVSWWWRGRWHLVEFPLNALGETHEDISVGPYQQVPVRLGSLTFLWAVEMPIKHSIRGIMPIKYSRLRVAMKKGQLTGWSSFLIILQKVREWLSRLWFLGPKPRLPMGISKQEFLATKQSLQLCSTHLERHLRVGRTFAQRHLQNHDYVLGNI